MKKTLALVLALVMVLALVPAAFASVVTLNPTYAGYTVIATATATSTGVEGKTEYTGTDTGKSGAIALTVKAPWKDISSTTPGGNIWAEDVKDILVEVKNLQGDWDQAGHGPYPCGYGPNPGGHGAGMANVKVMNGTTDVTDDITWINNGRGFSFILHKTTEVSETFNYNFTITGERGPDTYTENVAFKITLENIQKPTYELKFVATEENNAADMAPVNKDGKWYLDFTDGTWTPQAFKMELAKNNGEKFTQVAYAGVSIGDYVYPGVSPAGSTTLNDDTQKLDSSKISLDGIICQSGFDTDKEGTFYVIVETKEAFYKGKFTLKYRVNVSEVDPKGVFFGKDTYNIGVGEKFKIDDFTSVTPVYHSLASKTTLALTAASEKNVIDIDGKSIIGINEGSAYITLSYNAGTTAAGTPIIYTDTAKVVVAGKYTANPNKNYVVTGSKVNVRSGAGTSFAKIGTVSKGDVVNVISIENGWAKVVATNTFVNGYISQQYLALEATSPAAPVAKTVTVACRKLNVRAGGSTSFAKIGQVVLGTKLEVVATSNGWTQIKYGTGTAWVCSKYVA